MKKFAFILLLFSLLSCGNNTDNNEFLPQITVDFTINLNLSEGIELQINGGQKSYTQGLRGILVIRRSDTQFLAFDRACPHISLQNCSTMTFDALYLTCPCDDKRFNLINGFPEDGNINESAREYKVTRSGNILRVTNF